MAAIDGPGGLSAAAVTDPGEVIAAAAKPDQLQQPQVVLRTIYGYNNQSRTIYGCCSESAYGADQV